LILLLTKREKLIVAAAVAAVAENGIVYCAV
jgi:hypothetical protein